MVAIQEGAHVAELNVDTADLPAAADAYTELAARSALLSPQAAAEVQSSGAPPHR